MPNPTCETCRWWKGVVAPDSVGKSPEVGYCHRYPPTPLEHGPYWPVLMVGDFCGEHALPPVEPSDA